MTVRDFNITTDYEVTNTANAGASVRPSLNLDFANTKTLDPRITFTRNSTARYYNGVTTAKAEENLLLQSQNFDASWTNSVGATISSTTETAPDSSATATKILANNGASTSYRGQNLPFSITNCVGVINLTNGSATTTFGSFDSLTSTETSTGSGWYRVVASKDGYICSFFAKAAEYTFVGVQLFNLVRIYACNQSNSTTLSPLGDGTKGILIWGAQLEQRSAVTAYTPTTTQPITNYIPVLQTAGAGVARFNHNPTTGESLGLLIEEQRTNIRTYSEDFTNAVWTKSASSITADTVVAPDGTLTGDKLVEDTATSRHFVTANSTLTADTVYTGSVYLKAAGRTTATFGNSSTANWASGASFSVRVDLASGTIISGAGTIQSVGNGWYRVSGTGTFGAVTGNGGIIVDIETTAGYTGNGFDGIFIWGAQLEAGAFPTSYIPTVASQVTRSRDDASMTGANFSSWFNNAEGSFFVDYQYGQKLAAIRTIAVSDGTANNVIEVIAAAGLVPTVSSGSYLFGATGGVIDVSTAVSGSNITNVANARRLFAGAYKVNDYAACNNGGVIGADTSALVPTVDRLFFSNGANSNSTLLNGHIRKVAYYPKRLTNAELQTLTAT
jgi:hypothetical protein